MGHNVECHIKAVQRAQQLMDIECAKHKPDWRLWGLEGKKEVEFSDWVPRKILYFDRFVAELFETKTKEEAFTMIEDATPFLKSLAGARLQGGNKENKFESFFEVEEVRQDEIDLEDVEDPKMTKLLDEIGN
jgi:hypothetical protein